MKDINRVLVLGRLGADPILRQTQTGIAVTSFSLATDYYLKTKNASETTWHRIVVWGKSAEQCFAELRKGMPVFIEGNIRTRKYIAKDQMEKTVMEIHAENVRFLHKKMNLKVSTLDREAEAPAENSNQNLVAPHEAPTLHAENFNSDIS
jgi:single-strand DNA-binding protein